MKMDEGVDTGASLSRTALEIALDDTAGSLAAKLAPLGAELLLSSLPRYLAGELKPVPQDESKATHAPMLKKEEGLLDWERPAEELARRVRGLNPWPGAFFAWDNANLKVHKAHAAEAEARAGQRLVHQGEPAVGTGKGILVLDEVQPAGKKPMKGQAFLAGARGWET
jgi:methionyl-tRNA formyltransferase